MTEYKRDKGSLRTADKGKISAADIRKMRATGKAIIYDSNAHVESTRPLEDVIKDFLEIYKLGPKYTKARAEAAWSKVVGEYISSHTAKTYFANGILTVYLDSAVLRNELMFARTNLIRYLNEEIGNETVKDVKIR